MKNLFSKTKALLPPSITVIIMVIHKQSSHYNGNTLSSLFGFVDVFVNSSVKIYKFRLN